MNHADLLPEICKIARQAGALELKFFGDAAVREKTDGSPVTEADEAAEKLILEKLAVLTPDTPVVGEESVAGGCVPDISGGVFWLVDPLDGTKEFISGSGEFTVNIALIKNAVPVLGVVYVPARDELYAAAGPGTAMSEINGATQKISVRPVPQDGLTVIASRRHGDVDKMDAFLADKNVRDTVSRGSSLKFCAIASGQADLYPRFGRTCEWDTAAGDAVLRAAGGTVTRTDGALLSYGKIKEKFYNPEFIASADAMNE